MKQRVRKLLAFRGVLLPLGYAAGLVLSLWAAYLLRFEFAIPAAYRDQLVLSAAWVVSLQLGLLLAFGQISGSLIAFGTPDFRRLFSALASSLAVVFFARTPNDVFFVPPRSVAIADFLLALVLLGGWRLSMRLAWQWVRAADGETRAPLRRVGIIGAGDAGGKLALELLAKPHLGLRPVAFFDDDRHFWCSCVHGIPVAGPPEMLADREPGPLPLPSPASWFRRMLGRAPWRVAATPELDEAIIAMPSAPARRKKEIVAILRQAGLGFRTVPSLSQLATGAVHVNQLRPVEIEDLLGRDPVRLDAENLCALLRGKVVLVTGAGGSIGGELCKQIARFHPARLLMAERSEAHLFQIEQELLGTCPTGTTDFITPCIADVLDEERMESLFKHHRPHLVFHAAAHKHVPMMESHPGEAIKNNVFGTERIARLAVRYGAERFVLISTDKAINPTNVMGATKRLAEMFVQSLHAAAPGGGGTRFMGVRFGNVLGSSGSVIPTFTKQIATGGPVRITHPEITRYFMTIPEAVSLVLQSGAQGEGGEIFVLDMGKPVKILDLAREMIRLSGLTPGVDIELEFVGLRPGEKLYEELCANGENTAPTPHPKILRFVSPRPMLAAPALETALSELRHCLPSLSPEEIKLRLRCMIPEYQPYLPDRCTPLPVTPRPFVPGGFATA